MGGCIPCRATITTSTTPPCPRSRSSWRAGPPPAWGAPTRPVCRSRASAAWSGCCAPPPDERIVVGPDGQDGAELAARHGARFVLEDPPRSGPLAALARGVQEIGEHAGGDAGGDRKVLVLGGDMPLLRRESLLRLLRTDPRGTRVVALTDDEDQLQFLCAAWPLRRLREELAAIEHPEGGWANLSLRRLYGRLGDDGLITHSSTGAESADLDTPADLAEARSAAGPRVALAQIIVHDDIARNLETVRDTVGRAARTGADLVVFPEATLTPFGTDLRSEERRD